MIKLLLKNKDLIAVYKKAGLPSVPDKSGDADAMTLASRILVSMNESGELFPVHRLDRVTEGILVFARTKASAAKLSSLLTEEGGMGKEYLAVVDGVTEGGEMRDHLVRDKAIGKAFVSTEKDKNAKEARLLCERISSKDSPKGNKTLLRISLKTGRFHQIRAQLSSRGLPLTGDGKYGSKDRTARMPALFAYRLNFDIFGEKTELSGYPDTNAYPWNLFKEEIEDMKK